MATIERRVAGDGSISYRVKVRIRGARPETATFERKSDATKWATQTEGNIQQRKHFPMHEARKHTFGEMIDRYVRDVLPRKPKDLRNRQRQLEWWKARLGPTRLSDVDSSRIAELRDRLLSEHLP